MSECLFIEKCLGGKVRRIIPAFAMVMSHNHSLLQKKTKGACQEIFRVSSDRRSYMLNGNMYSGVYLMLDLSKSVTCISYLRKQVVNARRGG